MALGNASISIAIDTGEFEKSMSALGNTVHQLDRVLIEVMERMPTRGNALYNALNKPWEPENWRYLMRAPTKRKVRRMRADWEHADHCRWAAQLKKKRITQPESETLI